MDDIPSLAATYAVAVSSSHPFMDGNERAAFLSAGLFVEKNGLRLTAAQADAALTVFAVAAGGMDIETLAAWIRQNISPA